MMAFSCFIFSAPKKVLFHYTNSRYKDFYGIMNWKYSSLGPTFAYWIRKIRKNKCFEVLFGFVEL